LRIIKLVVGYGTLYVSKIKVHII